MRQVCGHPIFFIRFEIANRDTDPEAPHQAFKGTDSAGWDDELVRLRSRGHSLNINRTLNMQTQRVSLTHTHTQTTQCDCLAAAASLIDTTTTNIHCCIHTDRNPAAAFSFAKIRYCIMAGDCCSHDVTDACAEESTKLHKKLQWKNN